MKKVYCYVIIVLLAFIGCVNKDELAGEDLVNGNHTLKTQIEQSANTRTMVDEENRVCWVKGDQIGVFGGEGVVNTPFSFSGMADSGQSAIFKGNLPEGGAPSVAYYPYDDEAVLEGDKLSFLLPSEYDYTENSNAPMIGVKQDDGNFLFKHLCGLLMFSVEDMPSDVEKLVITSDGDNSPGIAGKAIVGNVGADDACLMLEKEQSLRSITINLLPGETKTYSFCIPLPVGEYPLLTFTFYLADGSPYFSNSIHGCIVRRATILNLGDPSIKRNGNFIVSDVEGFDGLYIGQDKSFWTYNNREDNLPEEMYIVMPSVVETGSLESVIAFDEQGLPDKLVTTDFSLKFFNIKKNSFDVYVVTDELTYCLREVQTEEPITDAMTKGVVEARKKLEQSKRVLNTIRVLVKGVKVCLQLKDGIKIPKKLSDFSSKEGFISLHQLTQSISAIDEYVNSFENFVFNKVECQNEQYISVNVLEKTSEVKNLLDTNADIVRILVEGGIDAFIDVYEDYLDVLEQGLYEWEQAIIEWEKLDKNSLGVITEDPGAITYTSATLNGKIKGAYQTDDRCGFIYSDDLTNKIATATVRELISADVVDLRPGTTYSYCAYYTPARYQFTIRGEQKSFTTQEVSIITGNAEEKTMNSAVVYGKEMGGWDAHQVLLDLGICYSSTCNTPTLDNCEGHVYAPKGTSGLFSVTLDKLQPNTKYYYRAFMVIDNYPVYYGEITYFITASNTTNVKALTLGSTNVTANSASINGQITGWDETLKGVVGFYYSSTDSDPKAGGTGIRSVSTSSDKLKVQDGVISFHANLGSLEPNTTYYYRTFVAINNVVESILGEVKSFKTSKETEDNENEMRKYLIQLYHDTDGDNWTRNDNWCSEEPLEEWYGVTKGKNGLYSVLLNYNKLNGKIDFQGCKALYSFRYAGNNNKISDINLRDCANLVDVEIGVDFHDELLHKVDISNCVNLKQISGLGNDSLAYFIASNCTSLKEVHFCRSYRTSYLTIDLTGCTALEKVSSTAGYIKSIIFKGTTNLRELKCTYARLTNLDLSSCVNLVDLDCSNNNLRTLDLSNCRLLESLNCEHNELTDLVIENCYNLVDFFCTDNKITKQVPESLRNVKMCLMDFRYNYGWNNDGTLTWYDNGVGWWYPGEPESGVHGWPD